MQSLLQSGPLRPVAFGLLAVACLASFLWPIIEYDSWSYHLPFSARLFDLGGDNYRWDDLIELRWQGFPLAWEWVQGLMWWLTGSLRATVLPQIALLLGYFWLVGRALAIRTGLLILGFFTSPLLILHQQGILNDLPPALCIATGFLLLLQSDNRRLQIVATLALGLAGNIKVQALLAVYIVAAIVVVARYRDYRVLALLAAGCVLASASVLSNTVRFGNPLYPFKSVLFDGPENPMVDANPPRYEIGSRSINPPQPIAFTMSATELDWTLRGVAPRYSSAMEAGNAPLKGGPSRTGGWGWLFILVNGLLLAVQLFRKERLAFATAAAVVLVALLPRSHELRYWLFLPLVLLPVNLRFLSQVASEKLVGLGLAVMSAYAILQTGLNPNSKLFFRDPLKGGLPPTLCDPNRDALLFRYSEAVTGNKVRLSQRNCPISR